MLCSNINVLSSACSKLHPEYGEDLLKDPIQGSGVTGGKLPNVLRMACKVDLLDQVIVDDDKRMMLCSRAKYLKLMSAVVIKSCATVLIVGYRLSKHM